MNDPSRPSVRSSWHSNGRRSARAGLRQQLVGPHEFENLLSGLRIVFLLIFLPPLVLSVFIFLVAALFPTHYPMVRVLVPNDCCRTILSIIVRIGLIPGLMLVIYQISGRRHSSQRSRFLAISLSVLLISVFAFLPFRLRSQPVVTGAMRRHPEMEHVSLNGMSASLHPSLHLVAKAER
jgi:hypothetical protein